MLQVRNAAAADRCIAMAVVAIGMKQMETLVDDRSRGGAWGRVQRQCEVLLRRQAVGAT